MSKKRGAGVLLFDGRKRGWKQIQVGNFAPSVDPNVPPSYLLDLQAQRTDDIVFTVRVSLDKDKIDLIPTAQMAMKVAAETFQRALNQMQTFRDCECTLDKSCKEHQRQ